MLSFGPFSALYFVFYEQLKLLSRRISRTEGILPMPWVILSSSIAGAGASFLTSPLDMAKLRLQVQRGKIAVNSQSETPYRGITDCLQRAYMRGGVRELFRGAGARVIHFVPATSKLNLLVSGQPRPSKKSYIFSFLAESCDDD